MPQLGLGSSLSRGGVLGFSNTYSLEFDGSSDYVSAPYDATLDIVGELTLSAWINPNVLDNLYTAIVSKRNGYTGNYQIHLSQGVLSFWHGGNNIKYSGYVPEINTWTHVAITISSGVNLTFYVNGIAIHSTALVTPIVSNIAPFTIGGNLSPGEYFSGKIEFWYLFRRFFF